MHAFQTRFLVPDDIPALLALEHSKWEPRQAACRDTFLQRMAAYPDLCVGAFCPTTGDACASLFMRPIDPAAFTAPTSWQAAARVDENRAATSSRSLFGISLCSTHPAAVDAIFGFFHPRAIEAGWRDVYLGSPIPGFSKARRRNPDLPVSDYVHAKGKWHKDEPLDPQLKYYYAKGFRRIVSIQENYFPHADSLDYGVILKYDIPPSRSVPCCA